MNEKDNPFGQYRHSEDEDTEDLKRWCELYDRYTRGEDSTLHNPRVAAAVAEIALIFLSPYLLDKLGEKGAFEIFKCVYPGWNGTRKRRIRGKHFDLLRWRRRAGRHPNAGHLIGTVLSRLSESQRCDLEDQLQYAFSMHRYLDGPYEKKYGVPFNLDKLEIREGERVATGKSNTTSLHNQECSAPELVIDLGRGQISFGKMQVETGSKLALEILSLLNKHPDRYYSAKELVATIWGGGVSENTVSKHIARARELLKEVGCPRQIDVKRGFGWYLTTPR